MLISPFFTELNKRNGKPQKSEIFIFFHPELAQQNYKLHWVYLHFFQIFES